MKKFQKTVTVYELGEGFYVEVSNRDGAIDFYLYHESYGVKDLAFSILSHDDADGENMVETVDFGEYIELYREQYMED